MNLQEKINSKKEKIERARIKVWIEESEIREIVILNYSVYIMPLIAKPMLTNKDT